MNDCPDCGRAKGSISPDDRTESGECFAGHRHSTPEEEADCVRLTRSRLETTITTLEAQLKNALQLIDEQQATIERLYLHSS